MKVPQNKEDEQKLAEAKRKLVMRLLTPDELDAVSGGQTDTPPHWREFTRFQREPG
ncbi:MAG: hypothetical protein U1E89_18960 [Burkholderiaceae bacterium]